jgi:transposase
MNILNLSGLNIQRVRETAHDYHVFVETGPSSPQCPECGTVGAVGFGRHEQVIRDLPIHGKRTAIYANARRFRCKACGKTFFEELPHVDGKRRMTGRLLQWIAAQAASRTFVSIAEEIGISEGTVRKICGRRHPKNHA